LKRAGKPALHSGTGWKARLTFRNGLESPPYFTIIPVVRMTRTVPSATWVTLMFQYFFIQINSKHEFV
jgi:hypothetical protein